MSVPTSIDQLAIWLPTNNSKLMTVEFGYIPVRSSHDAAFRVKNLSTEYRAVAPVLTAEGADAGQFFFSIDGGVTFANTVTLDDLYATAVSGLVQLRQVVPSTATLGPQATTLRVRATEWIPAHQTT